MCFPAVAVLLFAQASSTGVNAQKAQQYMAAGRYQQSAEEWAQVTKADPTNARAWYSLGRAWVTLARGDYEQLLALVPPDSVFALAVRADALLHRQQPRQAFAVFRAALAKDPDLVTAHLGLAAIYRSTGRPDWAALEERAAASLDCKTHAVDCDIVAGRYEAALAATSGDRTPRGIYFRAQARTGLANAAFAKVAQLPPSPDLHLYKAGLEYEAGHREQVVEELRQATQLAPRDVALRRELAMAMGAAAHYDAAYRLATELLRDDPGSDELNALAGDALLNLQKAEEAIPFLKKSAVANPRNPVTQRSLGMAYMKTGQARLALPCLEAAALMDADGSVHYQLALAYRKTGRPELAAKAMARYRDLSTKSPPPPEPEITPPL